MEEALGGGRREKGKGTGEGRGETYSFIGVVSFFFLHLTKEENAKVANFPQLKKRLGARNRSQKGILLVGMLVHFSTRGKIVQSVSSLLSSLPAHAQSLDGKKERERERRLTEKKDRFSLFLPPPSSSSLSLPFPYNKTGCCLALPFPRLYYGMSTLGQNATCTKHTICMYVVKLLSFPT